ncbi:hypothetical protein ACWGI0_28025 [Streptomyces sp. NPDC054802]
MAWGLAFGFQGVGYLWGWFWYWWADRSRAAARMRIRAYAWQFIVPFMGAFCLTAVGRSRRGPPPARMRPSGWSECAAWWSWPSARWSDLSCGGANAATTPSR